MANEKSESLGHSCRDEHKNKGQFCITQLSYYRNQLLVHTNALFQVETADRLDYSDETGRWVPIQWSKGHI